MSAARTIDDLPGPPRLPLLGNAHRVRMSRMHATAEAWCRRYGPLFRFDIGPRRFVCVGDADTINAILRDRPDGYRRLRDMRDSWVELAHSYGVFHAEGDEWRRQRRLAVASLNSNHLQRYYEIVATSSERLRRRLAAAALDGRSFDVAEPLTSFTVDVTSALAFGHDLNTLERGEHELQTHIQRAFAAAMRRISTPVPYWRWVKLPADRALDRSIVALREAVAGFVEQARQRLAARPELREAPESFLDAMLAAQETEGRFSDDEIFGNVMTFLLAGEDTTAHTMAWTIWHLAARPEIQARWAEEACEVLGAERFPAEHATIQRLQYGEAVLRESMRLTPVAPFLLVEPLTDVELAGVRVPTGTRIMLLMRHAGLHDGGVERPLAFEPERWLTDEGSAPDQRGFLAFGAGPRFCPGRNLALLESKAAMAMIARNFELELDPAGGPVTERFSFTMIPQGLRVRMRERVADPVLTRR